MRREKKAGSTSTQLRGEEPGSSGDRLRQSPETREAERKFELLLEAAPDAIVGVDIEGNIALANAQTEKLFGYSRAELMGQPVEILLPDAVRRIHIRHRESFTAHPHMRLMGAGLDLEGRRKDGSTFPVEISLSPLETEDGLLITSIIRDVTERKEAEEALRRSEENVRTLFERAPYGIYRSTPDGRFLMANPAMVKLLGYDSEEDLFQLNIARDVYRDPAQRAEIISRNKKKDHVENLELEWKRKDGTPITVRIAAQVTHDEGTGGIFYETVAEDITEQKSLEGQLRQAQKMEAIGRLAGGIAHDFNNLLMLIQGYGELLENALEKDHRGRASLDEILDAARRATSLTRQLLSFSRKQAVQMQRLHLNDIVMQTERMLRRIIGEDIVLITDLEPDLGPVEADSGQIAQIILNLAVNARDAMPEGGRLIIQTENFDPAKDREYAFLGMGENPCVSLTVSDTGIGMDAETQSKIFEPFFTTKEKDKGTGLGLANVYGIVRQAGGQIAVSSQPGKGCTFRIFLPRAGAAAQPPSERGRRRADSTGTETVLLVEDESALRNLAEEFLKTKGYRVFSAADGEEALRLAAQHGDTIDLLVTDMVMPSMNGSELAERLGRSHPNLKSVFISGYTPEELAGEHGAMMNGQFLQKPFPLDALAERVREVLDEQ